MLTSNTPPLLFDASSAPAIDIGGVTMQFLSQATPTTPALLRGVVPAGVFVPLHSHPDPETFLILSGELEGLSAGPDEAEWRSVKAGQVFDVAPNVPHAWRNVSGEVAVGLISTTEPLASFFQEIGEPVSCAGHGQWPPNPVILDRLGEASRTRGYGRGTTEENGSIGLQLPSA